MYKAGVSIRICYTAIIVTILVLIVVIPGSSKADTLHVGPGLEYGTIQNAVNASHDGDTIYVEGEVYSENVRIDRPLKLIGVENSTGGKPLIAHAEPTVPTVEITADDVVLDGFDLRGINSPDIPWQNRSEIGTGIRISGRSCQIRNVGVSGFSTGIHMVYRGGDGTRSRYEESVVEDSKLSSNVYGIWTDGESNLSIVGNDFTDNTIHMLIDESNHVSIYQNNFFCSHKPANFVRNGVRVVMNSSEPLTYTYKDNRYTNYTGNYWYNYTGVDSDSDGIGDTPHIIETRPSHWYQGEFDNYTDDYPSIAPMSSYKFAGKGGPSDAAATATPKQVDTYPPSSLHVLHVGEGQIYSTIQRAVNVSQDGDTIYVHGGVYPEAVVVDKQLMLIGVPNSSGGRPIIAGWASNTTPGMLITKGGVVVDGFYLSGGGNHNIGIHVKNPAEMYSSRGPGLDSTIRNVSFREFQCGLEMGGCNNVTVIDSEFMGNDVGISLYFVSNCSVSRCNFDDKYQTVGIGASWNVTFSQNNFIGYSGCGIGLTPYASEIMGNSTKPSTYVFRSKTYGNYTGNYWANYTGTDANDDGIGDSPYLMGVVPPALVNMSAVNITDDYPAMGRWSFENSTATIGEPTIKKPEPTAEPITEGPASTVVPAGSSNLPYLGIILLILVFNSQRRR